MNTTLQISFFCLNCQHIGSPTEKNIFLIFCTMNQSRFVMWIWLVDKQQDVWSDFILLGYKHDT